MYDADDFIQTITNGRVHHHDEDDDDSFIQQELTSLEERIQNFGLQRHEDSDDDHAVTFIEFDNDLFHVCREILSGDVSDQTRDSEVWSQIEDCCNNALEQKHLFFALGHLPFTYDPENLRNLLNEQEFEHQCLWETSFVSLLQQILKICKAEGQDAIAAGVHETLKIVEECVIFGSSINSLV